MQQTRGSDTVEHPHENYYLIVKRKKCYPSRQRGGTWRTLCGAETACQRTTSTQSPHCAVQWTEQAASSGAGPGRGGNEEKGRTKPWTHTRVGLPGDSERAAGEDKERTAITRDFATQGGSAARGFAYPSICRECNRSTPGAPPANPPANACSGRGLLWAARQLGALTRSQSEKERPDGTLHGIRGSVLTQFCGHTARLTGSHATCGQSQHSPWSQESAGRGTARSAAPGRYQCMQAARPPGSSRLRKGPKLRAGSGQTHAARDRPCSARKAAAALPAPPWPGGRPSAR